MTFSLSISNFLEEISSLPLYCFSSISLHWSLRKAFLFLLLFFSSWASLVAQRLKHLLPMRETRVRSLGREGPLEKEMVTHSSILAWRIPWTEEPGGLQSTGSQRVGHDWATSLHFSLLAILWNSAFKWVYLSFSPLPFTSFLFSAICKDSSDNHFAFFSFLFLGDGLDHCLLYNVTNLRP